MPTCMHTHGLVLTPRLMTGRAVQVLSQRLGVEAMPGLSSHTYHWLVTS